MSSPSLAHRQRRLVAGRCCAAHLEAEHRLDVREFSNQSLRQESANLAKQVAYWQRVAKRARVDLQFAEQDTIKHGNKGYYFSMRGGIVAALHRNIKGGIGAFPDLLQIDACTQSSIWACLALTSRNFRKQCDQFLDDADSTRTENVNYDIHFVMGDASNAGFVPEFQASDCGDHVQVLLSRCAEQRACLRLVGALA